MTAASYAGWQRQADQPSVQQAIEQAIEKFCGEAVSLRGAGRTDAGVHATAQVAHVDLAKAWPGDKVRDAINAHLQAAGERVAILKARVVPDDFDARFSATGRHYLYRILNRRAPAALEKGKVWWVPKRLDADAMHEAAKVLLGRHDFTTFRSTQCQANSPVRTLDRLDVSRDGRPDRGQGLGALLPAQSGALDGRLAEAGRRRRLDRGRPQGSARGARPRRLRPGGAARRAFSHGRRLPGIECALSGI